MLTQITNIGLPLTLALMMFSMGLQLQRTDFVRQWHSPKHVVLGLLSQFTLPPLLAVGIILLLPLPAAVAAGLLLVSLCPGGASSNLIAHLCRGDGALSVTLTALVSALTPITIPLLLALLSPYLPALSGTPVQLPFGETAGKLLVLTLVPTLIGMSIRAARPSLAHSWAPYLNKISLTALLTMITLLYWINRAVLPELLSMASIASLLLAVLGMIAGFAIGRVLTGSAIVGRTLSIEVGLQNASIAMFISTQILNQPEFAIAALTYGILMNIPALLLMAWVRFSPEHTLKYASSSEAKGNI